MTSAVAYFVREAANRFRPTERVGGGWDPREQHIAPVIGLITHAIETDHSARRGGDALQLSRISCDILGVIPLEPVEITVTVLRPGRTIELVEARLDHDGRTAVIARAWLTRAYETGTEAGTAFAAVPSPERLPVWDPTTVWPGGFVASLEVRRASDLPGAGVFWIRTDVGLIADEWSSPTARVLGLVDVANGFVPRASPQRVAFPNLDLTAHLFRSPEAEWIGFDTRVSFGPHGRGLTQSVLHDSLGPFGALAQTLTVRPQPSPE